MARFSNTSDIVIAELNVVLYSQAAAAISRESSYPSFFNIVHGNATKVEPERNLESFSTHAHALLKRYSKVNCSFYIADVHPYPAFVFSVPNASCSTLHQICLMTGLETDACLLGGDSGFGYQITFISERSFRLTANARDMAEVRDLTSEFERAMIPDWNGTEAKLALKNSLIIVYGSRLEVVNLTKILKPLVMHFLIRKVSDVRYRRSQIGSLIPLRETPTFLITDEQKSKIHIAWEGPVTVLDNFTASMTGDFDNESLFRPEFAFEKVKRIDWFWIVFVLSNSLVLVVVLWLSRGA
jgi:hypothetical protein